MTDSVRERFAVVQHRKLVELEEQAAQRTRGSTPKREWTSTAPNGIDLSQLPTGSLQDQLKAVAYDLPYVVHEIEHHNQQILRPAGFHLPERVFTELKQAIALLKSQADAKAWTYLPSWAPVQGKPLIMLFRNGSVASGEWRGAFLLTGNRIVPKGLPEGGKEVVAWMYRPEVDPDRITPPPEVDLEDISTEEEGLDV